MDSNTMDPRVCFKVKKSVERKADNLFLEALGASLRSNFGPVKTPWLTIFGGWGARVKVDGQVVAILLKRSKWDRNEWVGIFDTWDSSNKSPARCDANQRVARLSRVCQVMHAALSRTIGISDVRWYFQVGKSRSPIAANPDALPWTWSP